VNGRLDRPVRAHGIPGGGEPRAVLPPSLSELRRTSRSAAGLRWFAPFLLHQGYGGQVGRDEAGALLFDLFEVAL